MAEGRPGQGGSGVDLSATRGGLSPAGWATLLAVCLAVVPRPGSGQTPPPLEALGPFLDSLMTAEGVPGISFAVFDDQGVLYLHEGGVRNRATGGAVSRETVFEAASISKPVFAFALYSLAMDGGIDLDLPLHRWVDELPGVSYDPRSADLTPRLLLSHQGGLPNWRSRLNLAAEGYEELFAPGDTLRFLSPPGTGYRYSGEGYVLLQRVVEKRTGQSVEELVRRRVFEPFGMKRSAFRFDDTVGEDWSFGHDGEGAPDKWLIRVPLASSTLHTTAEDLARFGSGLARQLRDGGPYAALASEQVLVAEDGDWSLSWGLGLGVVHEGGSRFIYHGGNNVIFIADLIYGVEDNLGYVLMTNSANGARMVGPLEQRVFGRRVRR